MSSCSRFESISHVQCYLDRMAPGKASGTGMPHDFRILLPECRVLAPQVQKTYLRSKCSTLSSRSFCALSGVIPRASDDLRITTACRGTRLPLEMCCRIQGADAPRSEFRVLFMVCSAGCAGISGACCVSPWFWGCILRKPNGSGGEAAEFALIGLAWTTTTSRPYLPLRSCFDRRPARIRRSGKRPRPSAVVKVPRCQSPCRNVCPWPGSFRRGSGGLAYSCCWP